MGGTNGTGRQPWLPSTPTSSVTWSPRSSLGVALATAGAVWASRRPSQAGQTTSPDIESRTSFLSTSRPAPAVRRGASGRTLLPSRSRTPRASAGSSGSGAGPGPASKRVPTSRVAATAAALPEANTDFLDGYLRRRRVKAVTRSIYQRWAEHMEVNHNLSATSSATAVDAALDKELATPFLKQTGLAEARQLYYATRWAWSLTNECLFLSYGSLAGFTREKRIWGNDPVSWESTMVASLTLLRSRQIEATDLERFEGACSHLLVFDVHARAGDMKVPRACDLFPPTALGTGVELFWTFNFFDLAQEAMSKTSDKDVTKTVVSTNTARSWLSSVCRALSLCPRPSPASPLVSMTQPRLQSLFQQSRSVSLLQPATLHQLRHGGASADGAAGLPHLSLLERGPWKFPKGVSRYRKTGRYLRCMHELSAEHRLTAQTAPTQILAELEKLLNRLCRHAGLQRKTFQ